MPSSPFSKNMPELPEVQTIVNQLDERLRGRKIEKVEIRLPKIFFGDKKLIEGHKIISVERRAKIILLYLDNDYTMAVHLKMTGQLVYGERDKNDKGEYSADTISFHQGIAYAGFSLPAKTTHVIFDLDKGAKLFFNDNRQFGWIKVLTAEELQKIDEKHGPEPFEKDFTPEYLAKIIGSWGRPIKLLLMDQEKIAGIGNIYANEALWCAQISPLKKGKELAVESLKEKSKSKNKIEELYDCILDVLKMGIKYQGSSSHAESYVNALGEKGSMQEHFNVYGKTGQPCPRCQTPIVDARVGGRGTFYCPKCQK